MKKMMFLVTVILASMVQLKASMQIVFEDDFSAEAIDTAKWVASGNVRQADGKLYTVGDTAGINAVKSAVQFDLPSIRCGDDYALRVQWRLKPLQVGGINDTFDNCDFKWGCEVRAMGGVYHNPDIQFQMPFVVGLDKNMIFLNTTHSFPMPVSKEGWLSLSVDITSEAVVSFTVNGKEMLDEAIGVYKEGTAKTVHIRLSDYAATKSSTIFDDVKVSKVYPEDMLQWRIRTFDIRKDGISGQKSDYIATAVGSMNKIMREMKTFNHPIKQRYDMFCAGNEYESFQIAILAGADIRNMRLEFSALQDGRGNSIGSENLKYNPVGYVKSKHTYTSGPKVGWDWPDPLMPAEPQLIEAGFVQPFWTTVYVPENTPKGIYKGIITIKSDTAADSEILVNVEVPAFNLSKRSSLYTAFAFSPQTWVLWYFPEFLKEKFPQANQLERMEHVINIDGKTMQELIPAETWKKIYDFFLERRIAPSYFYQPLTASDTIWPFSEDWQYCADKGMNNICIASCGLDWLPNTWGPDPRYQNNKDLFFKDYTARIEKNLALARQLKWDGLTYVYGFDESDMNPDHKTIHDPIITEVFGFVGEKFPGLARASANPVNPTHFGLFDIWVPVTTSYDYTAGQRRQAVGEQMWCYVCCGPGKPMSNFFVDYPATDQRVLMWELSRANITGLLYWAVNYYCHETNWNLPGPRWPQVEWNGHTFGSTGDGQLIYPGPDMVPLSSVRLENIRNGIEDYDYYSLLRSLIEKAEKADVAVPSSVIQRAKELAKVPAEITSSFAEHTYNPELIESQRIKVGRVIEELEEYLM